MYTVRNSTKPGSTVPAAAFNEMREHQHIYPNNGRQRASLMVGPDLPSLRCTGSLFLLRVDISYLYWYFVVSVFVFRLLLFSLCIFNSPTRIHVSCLDSYKHASHSETHLTNEQESILHNQYYTDLARKCLCTMRRSMQHSIPCRRYRYHS